ncbi:hypothetical protein [Sphingomonas sp. Leaf242]|uniref:hypothetical protein n=1 Tax=Sphingomonas sp. Leaf242 TaxID=1736304 RepID=UPI000AF58275|nr:hypothetical protein [Sphingomonas sp. Leaf242]
MQRGPKLKNPATKKLAGTYKECVDGATAPIVELAADSPVAPSWLTDAGKEVWAADISRVKACGAREADSHFYAVYCQWMAGYIEAVKAGSPPNAAYVSELRKQMEMLGISGAKARLSRGSDTTSPANRFAKFK